MSNNCKNHSLKKCHCGTAGCVAHQGGILSCEVCREDDQSGPMTPECPGSLVKEKRVSKIALFKPYVDHAEETWEFVCDRVFEASWAGLSAHRALAYMKFRLWFDVYDTFDTLQSDGVLCIVCYNAGEVRDMKIDPNLRRFRFKDVLLKSQRSPAVSFSILRSTVEKGVVFDLSGCVVTTLGFSFEEAERREKLFTMQSEGRTGLEEQVVRGKRQAAIAENTKEGFHTSLIKHGRATRR